MSVSGDQYIITAYNDNYTYDAAYDLWFMGWERNIHGRICIIIFHSWCYTSASLNKQEMKEWRTT